MTFDTVAQSARAGWPATRTGRRPDDPHTLPGRDSPKIADLRFTDQRPRSSTYRSSPPVTVADWVIWLGSGTPPLEMCQVSVRCWTDILTVLPSGHSSLIVSSGAGPARRSDVERHPVASGCRLASAEVRISPRGERIDCTSKPCQATSPRSSQDTETISGWSRSPRRLHLGIGRIVDGARGATRGFVPLDGMSVRPPTRTDLFRVKERSWFPVQYGCDR